MLPSKEGTAMTATRYTSAPAVSGARTLTVLALVGWFVAAFIGGLMGIINEPGRPPLVLLGFIGLPILGFVVAYVSSVSFRAFADSLSLTLLVGSLNGALPAGFGIPEGFGDIIAASGALALLPGLRRGTASRGWLLAWNTWGFVDLVSAITMGVLYSNGPLGILSAGTVTTGLMVTFPVSLIPTFFVPLSLLFPALTFKRIANLRGPAAGADALAF